jgi:fructose transport system substrate-binding protein
MKYPPPNRRRARFAGVLAITAAATLALSACGGGNTGSGTPSGGAREGGGGKKVAVTLITKTSTNEFFIAMQNGAKAAGEKNNVDITTAAGKEDGDSDTQIQAIEAAVVRGDKGILITPANDAVNPAIEEARAQGLIVIALDTPPVPPDTVDLTIATDNFVAGELIGKWAAATLDGKKANIALLDLSNTKVVSVNYNRDQGFLTGMGIDPKDKTKNGDEDKTGKYTGGKGGDYEIFCNEPTNGAPDIGKTAMETCLAKSKDINLVYTINEQAAVGASQALDAAKVSGAIIVSVDGGCDPGLTSVKSGVIGATSQQYPVKMAEMGVETIAKMANGGAKPANSPGLEFIDAGVALVTDKPVDGVESIDTTKGSEICWGKK